MFVRVYCQNNSCHRKPLPVHWQKVNNCFLSYLNQPTGGPLCLLLMHMLSSRTEWVPLVDDAKILSYMYYMIESLWCFLPECFYNWHLIQPCVACIDASYTYSGIWSSGRVQFVEQSGTLLFSVAIWDLWFSVNLSKTD